MVFSLRSAAVGFTFLLPRAASSRSRSMGTSVSMRTTFQPRSSSSNLRRWETRWTSVHTPQLQLSPKVDRSLPVSRSAASASLATKGVQ